MSAGAQLERAHKLAARAAGSMSLMLEKRQLGRASLEEVLQLLEESAGIIKEVLTPPAGGARVGVPTPENQEK